MPGEAPSFSPPTEVTTRATSVADSWLDVFARTTSDPLVVGGRVSPAAGSLTASGVKRTRLEFEGSTVPATIPRLGQAARSAQAPFMPLISMSSTARASKFAVNPALVASWSSELAILSTGRNPAGFQRAVNSGARFIEFNVKAGLPSHELSFASGSSFALHLCRVERVCGETASTHISNIRLLLHSATRDKDGKVTAFTATAARWTPQGMALEAVLRRLKKLYPSEKAARRPIIRAILRRLIAAARKAEAEARKAGLVALAERIALEILAMSMAQQCLLRSMELLGLTVKDVSFVREAGASGKILRGKLALRDTKTSTEGEVFEVVFVRDAYGSDFIDDLYALCQKRSAESGPDALLFSGLAPTGSACPKNRDDMRGATAASLPGVLRRWLVAAGVVREGADLSAYVWHSLRHGGCTDLLDSGVPLDVVMMHGRWKSAAWLNYRHWTDRTRAFIEEAHRLPPAAPPPVAVPREVVRPPAGRPVGLRQKPASNPKFASLRS